MGAKKSKKHRKHGRNKQNAPAQARRTAANKARRCHREEIKAGRELNWTVAEDVKANLISLRSSRRRAPALTT